MTFIIVEGPRGAGKSTLATELFWHPKLLNCQFLHAGPPTSDTLLEEYLRPIRRYTPYEHDVVLDRWHLGELVYPSLPGCERPSLATYDEFAYLEMFLLSRGALLVHLGRDRDTVASRIIQRRAASGSSSGKDGDPVELKDVDAEIERFNDAVSTSSLPLYLVQDTSDFDVREVREKADHVVNVAVKEANRVRDVARFTTYVGPPRPDVLLFGDERGTTDLSWSTAFAPIPRSSGKYLFRSLPIEWLSRLDFGVANANESDDPLALWQALHHPRVVTLGKKAYDTIADCGLLPMAGAVPHPQYVRRFHHAKHREYGKLIERVAETKEDLRKWPR